MIYRAMSRIPVHRDGKEIYDILIHDSYDELEEAVGFLEPESKKAFIVTDSNVAPLYLDKVKTILERTFREVHEYVFPAGEENKTLSVVQNIYAKLISGHYERSDILFALGGGVTGDICGFCAATYLRGVRFVQLPTTLLSQVDSGIGGKTGVDFGSYKNMVGAFHMPSLVYTNIHALTTLSPEQYSAGLGEVIKHGLLGDASYYQWISENRDMIALKNPETLKRLITGSNMIKREVVEKDPTEKKERACLNFGHTIGHAIEKLQDFQMLHGFCVGLGSLCAMEISRKRGQLGEDIIEDYRDMIDYFGFPDHVDGIDPEEVLYATKSDKKMESGVIRFILLRGLGNAYIDRTVTDEEILSSLSMIIRR